MHVAARRRRRRAAGTSASTFSAFSDGRDGGREHPADSIQPGRSGSCRPCHFGSTSSAVSTTSTMAARFAASFEDASSRRGSAKSSSAVSLARLAEE